MSGGPPVASRVAPRVAPRVRERRPADVPVLADLLAEQQPTSGYPVRWPLPFAVEEFLVRPTERRAWVVETSAGVVGHVAVTDPGDLGPRLAAATGSEALGMVSVLFTGLAARGQGLGGLLLDTAVAWVRAQGCVPVLDVVPLHAGALALYRRRGWVEVGRTRFPWMAEVEPRVPDLLLMALPPYPAAPTSPDTTAS